MTVASPGMYVKVIGSLRSYNVSKHSRETGCKHWKKKYHTGISSPDSTGTEVATGNECPTCKGPE